jgi:hypothetical protein
MSANVPNIPDLNAIFQSRRISPASSGPSTSPKKSSFRVVPRAPAPAKVPVKAPRKLASSPEEFKAKLAAARAQFRAKLPSQLNLSRLQRK